MNRKPILATLLATVLALPGLAPAADYVIDTEKAHAFIQFRISHLGFSWLLGRFNKFSGSFTYDEEKPEASRVEVSIDPASIDSNHAERDRHLRGEDFLHTGKYPEARFVSTGYTATGEDSGVLTGKLTLRGVTREIDIEVKQTGHGQDPWGGYRRGFEGSTTLTLADYGIDYNLGPAARQVEMYLSIEGIRQ
ncbi:MAG TPA: YceI family protein [Gammaproteobacteria bacterium]|nr:YceI family protein [Gammaproteobacteria bacterium]